MYADTIGCTKKKFHTLSRVEYRGDIFSWEPAQCLVHSQGKVLWRRLKLPLVLLYAFLCFCYWLGPACNIILAFRLGLAWLGFFLEIKRLGLAWFGLFWCSFGLAWLGLEYFYHMKAWLGLACSEKTRLDDPYYNSILNFNGFWVEHFLIMDFQ